MEAPPLESAVQVASHARHDRPAKKRGRPPRQVHPPGGFSQPVVAILPLAPGATSPPPLPASTNADPKVLSASPIVMNPRRDARTGRHPHQQDPLVDRKVTEESSQTTTAQGGLNNAIVSALIDNTLSMKEEMRLMTEKLGKMKRKVRQMKQLKSDMDEMKQRIQQLEGENVTLRKELSQFVTSTASSSSSPPTFEELGQSSPKKRRMSVGNEHDGSNEESHNMILWCFPFLRRFNLSPNRFVIDDLRKPFAVYSFQFGEKPGRCITFASNQFFDISGYSMDDLRSRDVAVVHPRLEKIKFLQAWRNGERKGASDIIHSYCHMEHKLGHFLKIITRQQILFDPSGKAVHGIICIEQVVGADNLPLPPEEIRAREMADWHAVRAELDATLAARHSIQSGHDANALACDTPQTNADDWHDILSLLDHECSTSFNFSPSPPLNAHFYSPSL